MQQLEYWFDRHPDGFYKFLEPAPRNQLYRAGDSWHEELAMTCDEFRTAFDKIGRRHKSKRQFDSSKDKFGEKLYCSYFDRQIGLTRYFRNHQKVDSILDEIVVSVQQSFPKSKPRPLPAACTESQRTVDGTSQAREAGMPATLESGIAALHISETTDSSETTQRSPLPHPSPLSTATTDSNEIRGGGSRHVRIELLALAEQDRHLIEQVVDQHQLSMQAAQDLADEYCARRQDEVNGIGVRINLPGRWLRDLARRAKRGESILDCGRAVQERRDAARQAVRAAESQRVSTAELHARANANQEAWVVQLKTTSMNDREQIANLAKKYLLLPVHGPQVVAAIMSAEISDLSAPMRIAALQAIKRWAHAEGGSNPMYQLTLGDAEFASQHDSASICVGDST
ncbi:hypothetical protein [Ralstonia sp. GX3-BWBA]|uniref:hypothetical protein n=1 Tax=Ralstonia sp. GX3-BWBA TaxID=2219865 RepID=UPI0013A6FCAC|nr:hypothetical protein [Ralstonia sp. GX3-BWBA]